MSRTGCRRELTQRGRLKQLAKLTWMQKKAYDIKVLECIANKTAYDNKKEKCNVDQRTFEGDMCAVAEVISNGCESYEAAYTTRKNDYKTMSDEIIKHSKERVFEWTHLNRVACALQLLATHDVSNHEDLEIKISACSSTEYPKSDLVTGLKSELV